ncbi:MULTISPECIES: WGR domain-containing protein [Flavobacterium]|uniref:WGR domain-containing protein n=1 Tax=Flavobacterium jumunjinense TaxID=998845 RepID=A0ABV5GS14_9FLAO|nr:MULTISPECIES: WGR domain-containing protein [Flavobacterium]
MKLIKQIKLFYKEGNSDKVYEIDLCSIDATQYVVNFRYGRRGSVLKEGTKTPEYVTLEKAEVLFNKLEHEKTSKGYASEVETLIDLPSLESVAPDTIQGVVLQRLEDAVLNKQSFNTQWKTSRVIWKAGLLNMQSAIPYIIKLTSKGDDLQAYSSLWALIQLKSTTAEAVFKSYASKGKQKEYLKNIANEGLLTILKDKPLEDQLLELLKTVPQEVRYYIDKKDYDGLIDFLKEALEKKSITYLTTLYLIGKFDKQLNEIVQFLLEVIPFRPPFFKHVRAIYKLAHIRNDAETIGILSYRFENEKPMFKRTVSLDDEYYNSQYVESIGEHVNIGKELKGQHSKIAFSNFTKNYFQKHSLRFLKQLHQEEDAKSYLKFATAILLKYDENDYSKARKSPLSDYGQYDYNSKRYLFTLVDYPECSNLVLLSTILFGNDTSRILTPKLQYILGQEIVSCKGYFYNENDSKKEGSTPKESTRNTESSDSIFDSAKKIFSTFFGKKEVEKETVSPIIEETKPTVVEKSNRLELFPEHWDAFPEAYISLLMEAEMNIIHQFAYKNLSERSDFSTLIRQFEEQDILHLLNRNYTLPNKLGYDTLHLKKDELAKQIIFVTDVLDSNTENAREWAKQIITSNTSAFQNDIECIVKLIFNTVPDLNDWISKTLTNFYFSEDKLKAVTGKVIVALLGLEENVANNQLATTVINRLNLIASKQLEQLSWDIVAHLISSDLKTNNLLASSILLLKSKKVDPKEIPFSITTLFLEDSSEEIRKNGIQLLNNYPKEFLAEHIDSLFILLQNPYKEVIDCVLNRLTIFDGTNEENVVIKKIAYGLIRKESIEGAHLLFKQFILNKDNSKWNTAFEPRDIIKLVHANYRNSQLTGYEILTKYSRKEEFTIRQVISLGSHEILAIRQWCWNYFTAQKERIRTERNAALSILDTTWDDTRTFAFHFFKTQFEASDWDLDCLIGIVDSVLPEVEQFGKEMITQHFNPNDGVVYLTKLSQHPSANIQFFVTNYLKTYASDNVAKLQELDFYFRSVLTRVHKGRIAKQRVYQFLQEEGKKSETAALFVSNIIDDISATVSIQDKANCIAILTDLKRLYSNLNTHLILKN